MSEIIGRLVGSNSSVINTHLPSDDPRIRCPDVSLAESLLGWSASTGLDDGLKKTIEWFRG